MFGNLKDNIPGQDSYNLNTVLLLFAAHKSDKLLFHIFVVVNMTRFIVIFIFVSAISVPKQLPCWCCVLGETVQFTDRFPTNVHFLKSLSFKLTK